MPKKSRKIGRIGVRKSDVPKPVKVERISDTANRKKGNKPGSRQQSKKVAEVANPKSKKDPRIGDKTPIDLSKYDLSKYKLGAKQEALQSKEVKKVVYRTPQDELDAIENDTKLDALLEKQEESTLSKAEQAYVDKMTTRYRELCELMGIEVDDYTDDDEQVISDEVDPFANLDAIKLDDYKD